MVTRYCFTQIVRSQCSPARLSVRPRSVGNISTLINKQRLNLPRFVTLESENHVPLPDEPAWPPFIADIEAFLQE